MEAGLQGGKATTLVAKGPNLLRREFSGRYHAPLNGSGSNLRIMTRERRIGLRYEPKGVIVMQDRAVSKTGPSARPGRQQDRAVSEMCNPQGWWPDSRSYLKKVFWPKLGVGRSVQVLEIFQYSSGLRPTVEE